MAREDDIRTIQSLYDIDTQIAAWKKTAAAQFAAEANCTPEQADQLANGTWEFTLEMFHGDAQNALAEDPAEQASEEMSCWND